jgi:hypothetical protein
MTHILLPGDSIFGNAAYVGGEKYVDSLADFVLGSVRRER